jgi:ribosomal protein S18 acetylase RimI-like enzyme
MPAGLRTDRSEDGHSGPPEQSVLSQQAGAVTICVRKHFTGQVDAYIGELAVASDLERRGIATQLVNAAEAWAARRGLAFVTLETGAANHPARAFYAQRGYHEEDIRLTKALT